MRSEANVLVNVQGFSEHIEGMVFSLLSAQTVWTNIERNRENIRKLFYYFDKEEKKLSDETGLWMGQIDYILWAYCATDMGEICTAEPRCSKCVVAASCHRLHI